MGFFIRDLHNQIARLHSDSCPRRPLNVYRGQGMFSAAFETLRRNVGGLLSFNSFLSTSADEQVALARADSARDDPEMTGVFFQIEIDPDNSTTPYASLDVESYYHDSEREILFSTHTVFRIGLIEQIDSPRLWKVQLTLTRDTDEDLHQLMNYIRQEIGGQTARGQLGNLMAKMSEWNKAEEAFQELLEASPASTSLDDNASLLNTLGHILTEKNDLETASSHLERSLYIRQNLSPDHPDLALSYNNSAELCHSKGQLSAALSLHTRALGIWQKCLPDNHPHLALSHNNIGEVYRSMWNTEQALIHHQKALRIRKEILPATHYDLAMSYNNIGLVYSQQGQLHAARDHLEEALRIAQKSLPDDHLFIATTRNNIGEVYMLMGNYPTALSHHEAALRIHRKILPPMHPDLATSYAYIGMVYFSSRNHLAAQTNYENALAIAESSLPPDHPELARIHGKIGMLHHSRGECPLALEHCERALRIYRASLPADNIEILTLSLVVETIRAQANPTRKYQSACSKYWPSSNALPDVELD